MSAAGLGIAAVTAYRKRFLTAVRIAAYSLIPVGLVMTGAVGWLAGTAFSPLAWAGFGVLGASWALFALPEPWSAAGASAPSGPPPVTAGRPGEPGRLGARPRPGRGIPARHAPRPRPRPPRRALSDDFSDIEAILKKHGI